MEPKKNPKIDAGRNSSLYFSIGLICALSLSYAILQSTVIAKPTLADVSPPKEALNILEPDFNENIKIIEVEVKKTQLLTDQIKVVKKLTSSEPEKPIVQTIVDPGILEGTKDPEPIKAKDIEIIDDIPEDPIVDWVRIEDVPIFPGCEKLSKEEHRKCFENKLRTHIMKHQQVPEYAIENNISGKVNAQFYIDVDGQVKVGAMRGTHPVFEKEVQRVLNMLPKMTPGKQRLKAVKVTYAMPFVFRVH